MKTFKQYLAEAESGYNVADAIIFGFWDQDQVIEDWELSDEEVAHLKKLKNEYKGSVVDVVSEFNPKHTPFKDGTTYNVYKAYFSDGVSGGLNGPAYVGSPKKLPVPVKGKSEVLSIKKFVGEMTGKELKELMAKEK